MAKRGGARRDRTADLLHAMQALSQLSYGPVTSLSHDLFGKTADRFSRSCLPARLGDAPAEQTLITDQGRSQVSSSPLTSTMMSVTSSSLVSSISMSSSDSGTTAFTLPVFSSASASSGDTNSSASIGSGAASAVGTGAARAASARPRVGATGAIGTTSPV